MGDARMRGRRICVVPTCTDASVKNDELHGEECISSMENDELHRGECNSSVQPERNRTIANPQQAGGYVGSSS